MCSLAVLLAVLSLWTTCSSAVRPETPGSKQDPFEISDDDVSDDDHLSPAAPSVNASALPPFVKSDVSALLPSPNGNVFAAVYPSPPPAFVAVYPSPPPSPVSPPPPSPVSPPSNATDHEGTYERPRYMLEGVFFQRMDEENRQYLRDMDEDPAPDDDQAAFPLPKSPGEVNVNRHVQRNKENAAEGRSLGSSPPQREAEGRSLESPPPPGSRYSGRQAINVRDITDVGGMTCPLCGKRLVARRNRLEQKYFAGCTGYKGGESDSCKFTASVNVDSNLESEPQWRTAVCTSGALLSSTQEVQLPGPSSMHRLMEAHFSGLL